MLALLALLAGGAVFYFLLILNRPNENSDPSLDSTINYNPPTQAEIDAGNRIKDSNAEKNGTQDIANYSIVIVDARQYDNNIEVRSFVSGIVQDGGTCTYTFRTNGAAFTKTSPAVADASHTNCTPLIVPASEFSSPGTWSVSIFYSYENIIASSETKTIEVTK